MIGLDTNVLLRWLITDEIAPDDAPDQTSLVSSIILESGETFFVNHIVLAETVWVLRNRAHRSKEVVSEIIDRLLLSSNVEVAQADIVAAAQSSFRDGPGDFTDHLIGHVNRSAGCITTLTFDHQAGKAASLFTKPGS
jgi:predicted nucleic-acid-binding protein